MRLMGTGTIHVGVPIRHMRSGEVWVVLRRIGTSVVHEHLHHVLALQRMARQYWEDPDVRAPRDAWKVLGESRRYHAVDVSMRPGVVLEGNVSGSCADDWADSARRKAGI